MGRVSRDIFVVSGLTLCGYGAWMIFPPCAFVFTGIVLILLARTAK